MTVESDTQRPVMVTEAVRLLDVRPGETVLDATVGAGGHAAEIARKIAPAGLLIGVDRDPAMLEKAAERFYGDIETKWVQGNFRDIDEILMELGLEKVDKVLADLGWASDQVLDPDRGFSFMHDGPLDMRLDPDDGSKSASELVNRLPRTELERILHEYGEERMNRRIARAIVETRSRRPINTTSELKDIVLHATPPGKTRLHRATRTFQALRIAVNDELGALAEFLEKLPAVLKQGGRAVVISFHSLEDRLVKHSFRDGAKNGLYELLVKKPLVPADAEVRKNPRARSAKMRGITRKGRE